MAATSGVLEHTLEFYSPQDPKLWCYLLKCRYCSRVEVTPWGVGGEPTQSAKALGWHGPTSGAVRWERVLCGPCYLQMWQPESN